MAMPDFQLYVLTRKEFSSNNFSIVSHNQEMSESPLQLETTMENNQFLK